MRRKSKTADAMKLAKRGQGRKATPEERIIEALELGLEGQELARAGRT